MFTYRTYVLDGEADSNFSLSQTWNLLQDAIDPLPSNAGIFRRQTINCMRALMYLEATSSSPITVHTINHAHKIMHLKEKYQAGKDTLVGKCRKSSAFPEWHIFAPIIILERRKKHTISRFHEAKKDHPIMAATTFSGDIHLRMDIIESVVLLWHISRFR